MSKKWIVITPLLVFVLLCGFLLKGLFRIRANYKAVA